jgi:hypothetical protein
MADLPNECNSENVTPDDFGDISGRGVGDSYWAKHPDWSIEGNGRILKFVLARAEFRELYKQIGFSPEKLQEVRDLEGHIRCILGRDRLAMLENTVPFTLSTDERRELWKILNDKVPLVRADCPPTGVVLPHLWKAAVDGSAALLGQLEKPEGEIDMINIRVLLHDLPNAFDSFNPWISSQKFELDHLFEVLAVDLPDASEEDEQYYLLRATAIYRKKLMDEFP